MGLIKEPVEIDFTLLSRTWTVEDEREFSELIKRQKAKFKFEHTDVLNIELDKKASVCSDTLFIDSIACD